MKTIHHRSGRPARRSHLLSIVVGMWIASITIVGCDVTGGGVDRAVETLNIAIAKLETQSVRWQQVLEETRDTLIEQGQSTIAHEVSDVLSRAISDIGIEARCYTDFLRDRVREDLIRIRASITGETLVLNPVFCNPTPSVIDMNLPAERRPYIEISGYNLRADQVRVFLVDSQNQRLDVSSSLADPSPYLLTLNLGGNGVPLTSVSSMLVFELPNHTEQHVNIVQPIPAAPTPTPPVLQMVSVQFHTNDDDKDGDTLLSVYLYCPGGQRVAQIEGITGTFDDQSDSATYELAILRPVYKDQVTNCSTSLKIRPNGEDTWRFDYSIKLVFSDGVPLEKSWPNNTLAENFPEYLYQIEWP